MTAASPADALSEEYVPCVSAPMRALASSVARVAPTNLPVLICGETGTGKSVLARQVYESSAARARPLTVLQCATTTADGVSELAHVPEQTVVLEEVGDLAPAVQGSIVRVMAAAGPTLRFIATTSRDLPELAARQVIRADLLYRLDVVRLEILPLRQRRDDITLLAGHFLRQAALFFRTGVRSLPPDAEARLLQHLWPGNVRELRNCIVESVLRCPHASLQAADLHLHAGSASPDPEAEFHAFLSQLYAADPTEFYARAQRLVLQWALMVCQGNRSRAAALLGIRRGALRSKLRRYGLDAESSALRDAS